MNNLLSNLQHKLLKRVFACKSETRRRVDRNLGRVTASHAHRKAAARVGPHRDKHDEARNETDDEPNPPRNARRAQGRQDGAIGFRRKLDEAVLNRTRLFLGLLEILELLQERHLNRLGLLCKRIKNLHRRILEIIFLRRTLRCQRGLDIAATDRRLPVILEERVRLKETLIERHIVRKVHSVGPLHLLYLTTT